MMDAKKWLKATKESLKQEEYGDKNTCGLCICCNKKCSHCIISILRHPEESKFIPCADWETELLQDIFDTKTARCYLLELKYALEDYIRRNKKPSKIKVNKV